VVKTRDLESVRSHFHSYIAASRNGKEMRVIGAKPGVSGRGSATASASSSGAAGGPWVPPGWVALPAAAAAAAAASASIRDLAAAGPRASTRSGDGSRVGAGCGIEGGSGDGRGEGAGDTGVESAAGGELCVVEREGAGGTGFDADGRTRRHGEVAVSAAVGDDSREVGTALWFPPSRSEQVRHIEALKKQLEAAKARLKDFA
jgi:hypothetical protein